MISPRLASAVVTLWPGELVSGGAGGFALAFKTDALWVGTSIAGVDGPAGRLNATEAAVTRLRTGLEGSRAFTLGGRLSLKPSVEVGLRHDGGDAESNTTTDEPSRPPTEGQIPTDPLFNEPMRLETVTETDPAVGRSLSRRHAVRALPEGLARGGRPGRTTGFCNTPSPPPSAWPT